MFPLNDIFSLFGQILSVEIKVEVLDMCMQGDNQMTNRIVVKCLNCMEFVYHFNSNKYTFSM